MVCIPSVVLYNIVRLREGAVRVVDIFITTVGHGDHTAVSPIHRVFCNHTVEKVVHGLCNPFASVFGK